MESAVFKRKISALKNSAKSRNLKLKINAKHYYDLLMLGCNYCGEPVINHGGHSLDRVDSNRGYVNSNVVACCIVCNRAKNVMLGDDFMDWVFKVNKKMNQDIKKMTGEYKNSGITLEDFHKQYFDSIKNDPLNYPITLD